MAFLASVCQARDGSTVLHLLPVPLRAQEERSTRCKIVTLIFSTIGPSFSLSAFTDSHSSSLRNLAHSRSICSTDSHASTYQRCPEPFASTQKSCTLNPNRSNIPKVWF